MVIMGPQEALDVLAFQLDGGYRLALGIDHNDRRAYTLGSVLSYEQPVVVPRRARRAFLPGDCVGCYVLAAKRPSGEEAHCVSVGEKRPFFKSGRVENENPALVLFVELVDIVISVG